MALLVAARLRGRVIAPPTSRTVTPLLHLQLSRPYCLSAATTARHLSNLGLEFEHTTRPHHAAFSFASFASRENGSTSPLSPVPLPLPLIRALNRDNLSAQTPLRTTKTALLRPCSTGADNVRSTRQGFRRGGGGGGGILFTSGFVAMAGPTAGATGNKQATLGYVKCSQMTLGCVCARVPCDCSCSCSDVFAMRWNRSERESMRVSSGSMG